VTPRQAEARRRDPATLFIDVREADEWARGHIPDAVLVPKSHLEQEIETQAPDRTRPVVLYCAGGVRSVFAARSLQEMGYADVVSMSGGFTEWTALGLPAVLPTGLTAEQRRRYSRHLLMPEIGPEGQATLLRSRVLLVGAGGLGSPAALYLAAAGVGTLGVVDFDVVDVSNLQRQVLHSTARLGLKKIVSAEVAIRDLNPDVEVIGHDEALDTANVEWLIAGYDVIVDGTDTFETRYTLNDAAVAAGIPVVHASVFRFEGQLTTFIPFAGPCYRCLHPVPPPPELAPGCSVTGVLGVVPGTMGLLQATEALKLLLGIGETLAGRLVLFDALDLTFTELRIRRDPACPVCSDAAVEARAAGRPLPIPAGPGSAGVSAEPGFADESLVFPFPAPPREIIA
jgi:molybdopterin/thiamine biosynthesis adenylyltransferase/rhodanese-related sulfurtransferase